MPFVEISQELQLWYTSNAPDGDALKFDHSRATILLFHPQFLDSTWLRQQFQDPRLHDNYNLIAFDARSSGRTNSKVTPHRDAWVDGADVGAAMELLSIPRCHVFASQSNSVHAALRFGLLFPEMTLSLCLCQLPPTADVGLTRRAYLELLDMFCFPSSLEAIEDACVEMGYFMFNNGLVSVELEDEVYAWWQMNFPATKRTRFLENVLTCLNRRALTDAHLNRLKMPILVMQGDKYVIHSVEHAEADAARIPNTQFFVVKGGPEAFTMVPGCGTVVNRVYTSFLQRVSPLTTVPLATPHREKAVLERGLEILAEIFADPSITRRKPTSLSFSMSTPAQIEDNMQHIARYAMGEETALTALDKDGLPVRRVSCRKNDQWFETALDQAEIRAWLSPAPALQPMSPKRGTARS